MKNDDAQAGIVLGLAFGAFIIFLPFLFLFIVISS